MTSLPLVLLIGYALGALPTGVLLASLLKGRELLRTGSGHTGGTNVARATESIWAGVATALIDAGLAALSVLLGDLISPLPWASGLAGVTAVAGHNWSLYIGLRGGVGLSSLAGMLLAQNPLPAAVAGLVFIGLWLGLRKAIRHDARRTILTVLTIPLSLWLLQQPPSMIVSGAVAVLLIVVKSLGDWQRVYEEGEGVLEQPNAREG
ncbi:MAG: glycerol-3-phosphate acyltransferase [Anaerolineales bacterium]